MITHPEQARTLLVTHPQLAYALFQALLLNKIVDQGILSVSLFSNLLFCPFAQRSDALAYAGCDYRRKRSCQSCTRGTRATNPAAPCTASLPPYHPHAATYHATTVHAPCRSSKFVSAAPTSSTSHEYASTPTILQTSAASSVHTPAGTTSSTA